MKNLLFILLFLCAVTSSFGQKKSKIVAEKFQIFIESSSSSVKLTAKNGCAWKELTFTLKNNSPVLIDQFGMVGKTKNKKAKFSFSLEKTNKGLSLKSQKGTSWTTLNIDCPKANCSQSIDENGMARPDEK